MPDAGRNDLGLWLGALSVLFLLLLALPAVGPKGIIPQVPWLILYVATDLLAGGAAWLHSRWWAAVIVLQLVLTAVIVLAVSRMTFSM